MTENKRFKCVSWDKKTVKQFKDWLSQFEDDKEVTVIITEGDYTEWTVEDAFSSKQVYLRVDD